MRRWLVPLFALMLLGCEKDEVVRRVDDKHAVVVLFEADGCRIYRFRDSGRYHYFANCPYVSVTDSTFVEGKTTINEVVTTAYDAPMETTE